MSLQSLINYNYYKLVVINNYNDYKLVVINNYNDYKLVVVNNYNDYKLFRYLLPKRKVFFIWFKVSAMILLTSCLYSCLAWRSLLNGHLPTSHSHLRTARSSFRGYVRNVRARSDSFERRRKLRSIRRDNLTVKP